MVAASQATVVQILTPEGQIAGAGLSCLPRGYILTCFHVVADALRISRNENFQSGRSIQISSPIQPDWITEARVVASSPLTEYDLALLYIEEGAMPSFIRSVSISKLPLDDGTSVRFYGFPRGYDRGVWGRGRLQGSVQWHRYQIDAENVTSGFSGAPVEELQFGRTVGLLCASDLNRSAAFIITASEIGAFSSEILLTSTRQVFEPLTEGLLGIPGDPLSGVEQFIDEYLGTADKPVPFGGRTKELQELNDWLAHQRYPCMLVTAAAGCGKSALVVRWAAQLASTQTAAVVFVPVSNRFGTSRKSSVWGLLGKRLRFLCGAKNTQWPRDPDEWLAEIGSYLRQDRPPGGGPLVVILDGLDEAADWAAGEDIRFPSRLGQGIKILVTARLLGGDVGDTGWLGRLNWEDRAQRLPLSNLDRNGIQEVLEAMGNPLASLNTRLNLTEHIFELSEGDPLLVSLYVEALLGKGDREPFLVPEELPHIVSGLEGFINRWMKGQRKQWEAGGENPDRLEEQIQSFLGVLASAYGPITETDIREIAPRDSELSHPLKLRQMIRIAGRFVIGDGHRQGYIFSHPRLREYFLQSIDPAEQEQWQQRYTDYGRRTLTALKAGTIKPADASRYIVQYYRAHLMRIGAKPEDYYSVVSRPWMEAWFLLEGAYSGFLADIAAVWKVAQQYRKFSVEVLCALCFSSTVSLSSSVSSEVLVRCVRTGLFTAQQALSIIERMDSEPLRAEALVELSPYLSEALVEHALDLSGEFQNRQLRVRTSGKLGARLSGSRQQAVLRETLMDVIAVGKESEQYEILRELASVLPAFMLPEVLSLVTGFQSEERIAGLIECLAPKLDGTLMRRALTIILNLKWTAVRVAALLSIAPELSRLSLLEGHAAAQTIVNAVARAEYLARLCSRTQNGAISREVLELISRLRDHTERGRLLNLIADMIPYDLIPEAVRVACGIHLEDIQSRTLYALSKSGHPSVAQAITERTQKWSFRENAVRCSLGWAASSAGNPGQVSGLAVGIRNPLERAEILIELVGREAQRAEHGWLAEAHAAILANLEREGAARLLQRLAPLLNSSQLQNSLDAVLSTTGLNSDVLQALIPHLNRQQIESIYRSLTLIGDAHERGGMLAMLAQFSEGRFTVDVLDAAASTNDDGIRATALISLAAELSGGEKIRAQTIAVKILRPQDRAASFVELARYEAVSVPQALATLDDPGNSELLDHLLSRLGPVLDFEAALSALDLVRRHLGQERGAHIRKLLFSKIPESFRSGTFEAVFLDGQELPATTDADSKSLDREDTATLWAKAREIPHVYYRACLCIILMAEDNLSHDREQRIGEIFKELCKLERIQDQINLLAAVLSQPRVRLSDDSSQSLLALLNAVRHDVPHDQLIPMIEVSASWLSAQGLVSLIELIANLPSASVEPALISVGRCASDFLVQEQFIEATRVHWQNSWQDQGRNDYQCARILCSLGNNLRYSPLISGVVEIVRQFEDSNARAHAFAALVRYWPTLEITQQALSAIQMVRNEESRAAFLSDIAPQVFGADAQRAYQLALGLQQPHLRLQALRQIRSQLSAASLQDCWWESLKALESTSGRYRKDFLPDMMLFFRPSKIHRLLPLAWTIWEEDIRREALSQFPAQASTAPVLGALSEARSLYENRGQIGPFCALAVHVPESIRVGIIHEAIGLLVRCEDVSERIDAAYAMFPASSSSTLLGLICQDLNRLGSLDAAVKALNLALAGSRPESDRQRLVNLAWELFKKNHLDVQDLSLMDALWPQLEGDTAAEAWRWSWTIWDRGSRASVQNALPKVFFQPPSEETFLRAMELSDPDLRFEVVWGFHTNAGVQLSEGDLSRLLWTISAMRKGPSMIESFRSIILELPAALALQALHIAVLMPWQFKPEALDILDPLINADNSRISSSELIDFIAKLRDDFEKAGLVARYAGILMRHSPERLFGVCIGIGKSYKVEALIALLHTEITELHDAIACALVRTIRGQVDWEKWDITRKISIALRVWGGRYPERLAAVWMAITKEISHMRRPQALEQLTILIPATLSTFSSDEGPAVARAIQDVCSWWP